MCPLSSGSKMWKLVCKLCAMKNVECILPFKLWEGALAIYKQLSAEQKADAEQIKQALITAYATDAFNAYDQFVNRQLCPGETADKFFAELWRLAWLVGGTTARTLVNVRICFWTATTHLLHASSRMETMSAEQLLIWARAVMTDNKGPAELAATPPPDEHLQNLRRAVMIKKFATWWRTAYRIAKKGWTVEMRKVRCEIRCFRCSGLGHIASQCQGNAKRGGISISLLSDQLNTRKLPSMKVHVDGQECTALIDSGCSQTLVSKAVYCVSGNQRES